MISNGVVITVKVLFNTKHASKQFMTKVNSVIVKSDVQVSFTADVIGIFMHERQLTGFSLSFTDTVVFCKDSV